MKLKFEFLGFWLFLIGLKTLLNIQLIILHDEYIVNFEISLFNIELIGLYIYGIIKVIN